MKTHGPVSGDTTGAEVRSSPEGKPAFTSRLGNMLRWLNVTLMLAVCDIVTVNASYFLALWFRYDCRYSMIPPNAIGGWLRLVPWYTIACLLIFWAMHLYKSVWRFASYVELVWAFSASLIASALHSAAMSVFFMKMPISYHVIGALLQVAMVVGVRFIYRLALQLRQWTKAKGGARVMLVGAGAAGQIILRDIRNAKELTDRVVCIIDDNPGLWGRYLDGVPIVGGRYNIPQKAKEYRVEKIYLTVPSASSEDMQEITNICKETQCAMKNLPGVFEVVSGSANINSLQDVPMEYLLGREPVKVRMREVFSYLKDKVILVTGGGGSIGSELCRQIAAHEPKTLIIFDFSENYAYAIENELRRSFPSLDLHIEIGSVRDSRRINHVFATYKPDVVYHAAAHKHVPMMEYSPCEAIKNNAIGTYKTAYAAMLNDCKRFVLISTDKAVNPTNMMGASKRLCEMVIQTFAHKIQEGRASDMPPLHTHTEDADGSMKKLPSLESTPHTEFVAVRFGNVLGSNGSVIPIFKEQIARGGPVTVTDPDVTRFFMTIPEAVSLVLQAGYYAKGGEIFVLDMGEPVKIDDLARTLIRFSGKIPDVDIMVKYTKLRPGEKLYEEKLMKEEGMQQTPNKKIFIGKPIDFDTDQFLDKLQELMEAAYDEREDIRELTAKVVTTYQIKKDKEYAAQRVRNAASGKDGGAAEPEMPVAAASAPSQQNYTDSWQDAPYDKTPVEAV